MHCNMCIDDDDVDDYQHLDHKKSEKLLSNSTPGY